MPPAVSVLLVDAAGDHVALRRGLERAGSFQVVGEAGSGTEAIELSALLQPDVVVLDLTLPRLDGRAAIDDIRRRAPESRILALSSGSGTAPPATARRNGPIAYMERRGGAAAISSALATLCDLR